MIDRFKYDFEVARETDFELGEHSENIESNVINHLHLLVT
jgi:hypothetical protein